MIKPILIPADESNILKSGFNNLWETPPMKFKSSDVYVDIILIDTEAEITEDDLVYDPIINKVFTLNTIIGLPNKVFKVISSTNKSHKSHRLHKYIHIPSGKYWEDDPVEMESMGLVSLPQLSSQAIQLLIAYYNDHKCMPESVIISNKGFSGEIRGDMEFYIDITIIKL